MFEGLSTEEENICKDIVVVYMTCIEFTIAVEKHGKIRLIIILFLTDKKTKVGVRVIFLKKVDLKRLLNVYQKQYLFKMKHKCICEEIQNVFNYKSVCCFSEVKLPAVGLKLAISFSKKTRMKKNDSEKPQTKSFLFSLTKMILLLVNQRETEALTKSGKTNKKVKTLSVQKTFGESGFEYDAAQFFIPLQQLLKTQAMIYLTSLKIQLIDLRKSRKIYLSIQFTLKKNPKKLVKFNRNPS